MANLHHLTVNHAYIPIFSSIILGFSLSKIFIYLINVNSMTYAFESLKDIYCKWLYFYFLLFKHLKTIVSIKSYPHKLIRIYFTHNNAENLNLKTPTCFQSIEMTFENLNIFMFLSFILRIFLRLHFLLLAVSQYCVETHVF